MISVPIFTKMSHDDILEQRIRSRHHEKETYYSTN